MKTSETKNEGAYKAGDGKYIFDIKELKGLMAGPDYSETIGPVVEGVHRTILSRGTAASRS